MHIIIMLSENTHQFGNWTDFISLSKRVGVHRRTSAPTSSSLRKQSGCESQVQCHVTQSDSPTGFSDIL